MSHRVQVNVWALANAGLGLTHPGCVVSLSAEHCAHLRSLLYFPGFPGSLAKPRAAIPFQSFH